VQDVINNYILKLELIGKVSIIVKIIGVKKMDEEIDFKTLWFNICEEKKQLELENHTLKVNGNYWRRQAEKFERMFEKDKKRNNNSKKNGYNIGLRSPIK